MPDLFGWYTPPAASTTYQPRFGYESAQRVDPPAENALGYFPSLKKLPGASAFYTPAPGAYRGDSGSVDSGALAAYLQNNGYSLIEESSGGTGTRYIVDAQGNLVDRQYDYELNDNFIRDAAVMAGTLYGGSQLALGGFGGGAAAATPAASAPAAAGSLVGAEAGAVGGAVGGAAAGSATGGLGGLTGGSLLTGGAIPAATPLTFAGMGAAEAGVAGLSGFGGLSGAVSAANMPTTWDTLLQGLSSSTGVRSIFDIASGIYGLNQASNAREASDPFAQYRAGYGQQLQALETNPASITSRPGWRAGLEGIDRQMAARGYYGSGNMDAARTRYAGDFYGQEVQRLAGLAGANQTPGAGQFQSANLAGNALASIGYGLAPWLSGRPQ